MLVVRNRNDLVERVIPFFDDQPLLSSKQLEFLTFRSIVLAMAAGRHLEPEGFEALRALALTMNGGGRYAECIVRSIQNPQRPYAEHRLLDR